MIRQVTVIPLIDDRAIVQDAFDALLGLWVKHGHITNDPQIGWHNERLHAICTLPRPDAIDFDQWQRSPEIVGAYATFSQVGRCESVKTLLDEVDGDVEEAWQAVESFFLFAHWPPGMSSICAWPTHRPIPIYLLSLDDALCEAIYFWTQAYNAVDVLWLHSSVLEMATYTEMVDPHSDLAREGRTITARIEEATGKPTYYFLNRYYGYHNDLQGYRCPHCGQSWEHLVSNVGSFLAFRCIPCRLIIGKATDFEHPEYAPIGKFSSS